ncbi:hypothetical protein FO519_007114 [Halicephalobus sp. NKZ332]|nr:hypothetical protein FO519_007114 [Halicephalobus sp. NKZ332]
MSAFKIAVVFFTVIVLVSSLSISRDEETNSDFARLKRNTNKEELIPLGRRLREILGRASRIDGSTLDSDSSIIVPRAQTVVEEIPVFFNDDELLYSSELDSDTYETDRSISKRRIRYKPMH